VYQVTQANYREVTTLSPSKFSREGVGAALVAGVDTSAFPVETVSWDDAVAFCKILSAQAAEQEAGRVYRLPSEAEWEYSCRAGLASGAFHFGDSLTPALANVGELDITKTRTCPVGAYPPNAWGLYDMHGNVWEWCADWLDDYTEAPATDPRGSGALDRQAVRGGCSCNPPETCRTAFRNYYNTGPRGSGYGFRVACDITARRA
jgi:formylglycine-generating enzyme required for sulfatase activity